MTLCINPHCQSPQNADNAQFCQNCQSSLLIKQRYRAMRVLEERGFAKTYVASDLGKQNKVIKVLTANTPEAVELFQQEAEVLSQINNPGIPQVEPNGYLMFRPANSEEPVHCLIMEKVEGPNLRDYIHKRGRPIDSDTATRWLQETVMSLQALHEKGTLHRDIKPKNIIVKPDNRLVLINLGAVRQSTGTEVATAAFSGSASGGATEMATHMASTSIVSAGYTPPEQMNGQAVPQSDIYSLGRTFIFLLTGKEPSAIPYDPLDDVLQWREHTSDVSDTLAQLLNKMQSTLVRLRPKHIQEILQELSHDTTQPHSPILGEDVEVQLTISPDEAKNGAEKSVQFTKFVNINDIRKPEVTALTVTIPKGAKEGDKLCFKGKGSFHQDSETSGDLYVQLALSPALRPTVSSPPVASKQPKASTSSNTRNVMIAIGAITVILTVIAIAGSVTTDAPQQPLTATDDFSPQVPQQPLTATDDFSPPSWDEKLRTSECFVASPSEYGEDPSILEVYSIIERGRAADAIAYPGERVLSLYEQQGVFIKIELSDGFQGWVFDGEIVPC